MPSQPEQPLPVMDDKIFPIFRSLTKWVPEHPSIFNVRKLCLMPETVRLGLAQKTFEFAASLSTTDLLELSRNPEYQPQASNMWVETKDEKSGAISFFLSGHQFYFFVAKGERVIGNLVDITNADDEGAKSAIFLLSGVIRFFNVVSPKFWQKENCSARPPGRKFNGMPFSPLEFSIVSLRGHQEHDGEHSATDAHGVRFHFVRGHYMLPSGKTEKVWRRSHWRGDPALGTVRSAYVG